MKLKLFAIFVLILNVAHARQYIQCAHPNSWDRAVINLDGDRSTLFMTNGVHLPDEIRVLKKLYFVDVVDDVHVFETKGDVTEKIYLPTENFGRASSFFYVELELTKGSYSQTVEMSCFSIIYEN